MTAATKYKIFSLDGDGSWAIIQIRTLQDLYGEKTNGRDILAKFDLVIGQNYSKGKAIKAKKWIIIPLLRVMHRQYSCSN